MALYTLSRFHASEHVDTFEREYVDDLDALDAAHDLCTDHTVEVYDDGRFVARIKRADEPINVRDGAPSDKSLRRLTEDVQNRVDVAGKQTQQLVSQSNLSIAQDWDARSSSTDAVRRSRDTLTRVDKQGSSTWDPTACGGGVK